MRKLLAISVVALMAFSGSAQAAVVLYDSPDKNFITGIDNLTITGTANDGTYDVVFVESSFNDAYGLTTMTSDLIIAGAHITDVGGDPGTATDAINSVLNSVTPNGPIASAPFVATPAAVPFTDDAFVLAYWAETTIAYTVSLHNSSTGQWSREGGSAGWGRDVTFVSPIFCNNCNTKFAVIASSDTIVVPAPGALALLGFGLMGIVARRRTI